MDTTQVTSKPTNEFANDRPLVSKLDDKLNRAPFVDRVVEVLLGLPQGTSLVVGIYGKWGDGKTTVLNMLRSDLEKNGNTTTVMFNPWRFTDEGSMLAGFFHMLAGATSAKLMTARENIAGWFEKYARYAGVANDRFDKAASLAASVADPNLEELHTRLSAALAEVDKRVVVFVDDIDRLDKHETHILFRLIKACADFPNVSYVLAFDDSAVAKALGDRYGGGDEASGRAFLEKIVQVSLKLPVAMKEDLRSLCFEQVDKATTAAGIELSHEDIGRFVSGFDRVISIQLDTPRAAKRYGNALMFALPMLKGEVDIVDLLLIEAVRSFYPKVYDVISVNYGEFSGVESGGAPRDKNGPRAVILLKPLIESLPSEDQDAIKLLLQDLFPRLGRAYGRGNYGSDWLAGWAKNKRICSPDYCPRYFSYIVPKNDVRDSEIEALYQEAATGSDTEVVKIVADFFKNGKAKRVIERLREKEKSTPPQAVRSLCLAVAMHAKHIPNPPALFDFAEPVSQAGILISHLIQRLPAGKERVDIANCVIKVSEPLWFGAEIIRRLCVADEPDNVDQNILTKQEVMKVHKALVVRAKAAARAGEPLFNVDVRQEQSLLFEWWRVEGREPVQKHLSKIFKKDSKNLGLFLQAMAPRAWHSGSVMPFVGQLEAAQLESIKLIYDLDALADLIRKNLPGDFENPKDFTDRNKPVVQNLAEQYMYVYNEWKKNGEPSDAKLDGNKN